MKLHSLAWRTELFIISSAVQITEHSDYIAVRSERWSNHIWKNFLLFSHLPAEGNLQNCLMLYEQLFPTRAASFPIALAWDCDQPGSTFEKSLKNGGFRIDRDLVYRTIEVVRPESSTSGLTVSPVADAAIWDSIVENRVAILCHGRHADLQAKFESDKFELYKALSHDGSGSWFRASIHGKPVGDMGVFVSDDRLARLQEVLVYPEHQHVGIGRTMIYECCNLVSKWFSPRSFVTVCDVGSAACRSYRAIGFQQCETQVRAQRTALGSA
jgi:GNAT superfamily N-acetyltransferase